MNNRRYILILLLVLINLGICSCSKFREKIASIGQKDYSGNYLINGGAMLEIHQNPDKTVWMNYGGTSTGVKFQGNQIQIEYSAFTIYYIVSDNGKTLHSKHKEVISYNVGRKIEDNELWSTLQSYNRKEFVIAETGFRKYLDAHPNDILIQIHLTITLLQQRKLEDAKTEFAKFEHNPEIETNSSYKHFIQTIRYTFTGLEKSNLGQNAWDGYEKVLNIAVAAPQVPQHIYTGIRDIETKNIPIGYKERNIIEQYIAPNMNAIQTFITLSEKSECYVISASQNVATIIPNFLRAHQLAKSVILYGHLLIEDGKIIEAVDAYRRVIRFGQQLSNGPLVQQLISVAIRSIGESAFSRMFREGKVTNLEEAQLIYNTLTVLQKNDPISSNDTLLILESKMDSEVANLDQALKRSQIAETKLIQLRTASATILYKFKEGKWPESLEVLVPNYLSEIPTDTINKNPLFYDSQKVQLYSMGPDKSDVHGEILYDPTNGTFSKGDLIFP